MTTEVFTMPESKLTTAQRRVEQASEALNTLLEEGATPEQTTKARDVLAAAERSLREAEKAEADRQAKIDAERRKEADALLDELSAEISAKMAEIVSGIASPAPPRISIAHAQATLKARQEAASATETLTQAKARQETLEERHADLSQRWDSISRRRAQGDARDADQGELVVLAADMEGLETLIEEAQAEIEHADLNHARAAESLKQVERRWLGLTSASWRQAMQDAAAVLEARIALAADEIRLHPGWNNEQQKCYEPTDQALQNHLHATAWSPYPQHRDA